MNIKIDFDKNPTILNEFLYYLLNVLNYSLCTIKAYSHDLTCFFEFIKNYLDIDMDIKEFNIFILLQIKETDIIAFLVYCNFSKNNSPYTRQRKLCAIRRFYKWLFLKYPNMDKENPTKELPNIEKVVRIPRYLNLEQAKRIQEIFTLRNSKFPARNNAIISLFLSTGIRASELININLNDINFNDNTIKINVGKGNKERKVYINSIAKENLLKYICIRNKNKKLIKINDALFISYHNRRIGIDGIEDVCAKAYELMGLQNHGYTTHTLRHTAASLMYIYVKQDILLLREFLGHARITSTEIYTHIYNKKLKEAVDKNPLNNFYKEKVA